MIGHQLICEWRARLALWQQRLDEGMPRPWLARAYVRVLTFLLAQYAPQGDSATPTEVEPPAEPPAAPSTMKLQVTTTDLTGKPARTPAEIRSVLDAVRSQVPHAEQGPLMGGLHPDDPIAVAAFYRVELAMGLQMLLEVEGIESRLRRFRRQTQVLAKAGDLERAKPIVARYAAGARDSSRWGFEYARAMPAVCGVFGFLLGAIATALICWENDPILQFFLSAYFGILSGGVGCFVGLIVGTIADG